MAGNFLPDCVVMNRCHIKAVKKLKDNKEGMIFYRRKSRSVKITSFYGYLHEKQNKAFFLRTGKYPYSFLFAGAQCWVGECNLTEQRRWIIFLNSLALFLLHSTWLIPKDCAKLLLSS